MKRKKKMEDRLDEGLAKALRKRADTVKREASLKALCPDGTGPEWPGSSVPAKEILQEVMKMSDDIRKMKEEPYRKVLRNAGMDEDNDWIFISQHWANVEDFTIDRIPPSLRNRVRFTPYITSPMLLVRCPFIGDWEIPTLKAEKPHA